MAKILKNLTGVTAVATKQYLINGWRWYYKNFRKEKIQAFLG